MSVNVNATASTSFLALGLNYTVEDVSVAIISAGTNKPITFNITGSLSGVDNLMATVSFQINPFAGIPQ